MSLGYQISSSIPTNTKINVAKMLAHRLRRWPKFTATLVQRLETHYIRMVALICMCSSTIP